VCGPADGGPPGKGGGRTGGGPPSGEGIFFGSAAGESIVADRCSDIDGSAPSGLGWPAAAAAAASAEPVVLIIDGRSSIAPNALNPLDGVAAVTCSGFGGEPGGAPAAGRMGCAPGFVTDFGDCTGGVGGSGPPGGN
jgi:hypothetical protein